MAEEVSGDKPTYRVILERDDDNSWFVQCPTVPGTHSHGRTLTAARANIREAIALVLDLDPSTFDLVEEVHSPMTRLEPSRQRREKER